MNFAVVRLGKDSVEEIKRLNHQNAGSSTPFSVPFTCTQVPEGVSIGDFVVLWLGSDNNKGQATSWKQGVRGIAKLTKLDRTGGRNDPCHLEVNVLAVLPDSLDRHDFLEKSASHYKYFSRYPVIGVNASSNNTVQQVHGDEGQNTTALLTALNLQFPVLKDQLEQNAPELIPLLNFVPVGNASTAHPDPTSVSDTDDVWEWISKEIFAKKERNFLFLGAPGTGKTWYAHEIAKKLTDNNSSRHSFVQFHPSFSYDDFVEGYTPKLGGGGTTVEYRLEEKHILNLCSKAKGDGSNLYVMVIDELSRGDPSRVFGEFLTYLEVEHRNREFSLAYSGAKTFVPENLIIIATANPYDRSVGELDDALVRRFAMRDFPPDAELLNSRLKEIGASDALVQRLIHVFEIINQRLPNGFGHSHFWNIRSESDFLDLWETRIRFLLKRALQFEDEALKELQLGVEAVFPKPAPEVIDEDVKIPEEPIPDVDEAT